MEESKEPVATECREKMTVVVAVDESEGSLYALSWALDNLFPAAVGGAPNKPQPLGRLVLVHAQQPLQHLIMHPVGPAAYATSSVIDSVKKAQDQNSRDVVERAKGICRRRLVEAEAVIVIGDPKETICQAAEQMQTDLLVVGSRGLSKIRRAILGSVSDYCAHHANCPVLIVKPPKGGH
ncbi:hypothetical protein OPV22_014812 [Ensete ventricosum]|uniref:UspA domain-containing protein n=1 Tax=Ensete ventricosum TaxID=4639 RepID=A0AAV8R7Y1_ENSVE|nr:hypothetical protein OPV22_014812 [Ensete ventricosum]